MDKNKMTPGLAAPGIHMRKFFCVIFLILTAAGNAFAAAPAPQSATLDAARVSYNDETGRASAEGGAVLTYGGATIRGERIDYDVASQKARALSLPGGSVTLESQGRSVAGDALEYDLATGEAILTGTRSALAAGDGILRISGGEARMLPYDLAAEQGLVKKNSAEVSYVGMWDDTSATTCALDHPHYRLETKRITFIPGQRLIASKPRLYLGNTFLFTYPADYVVQIDRQRHSLMPYVQHNQEKGLGVGFSGAYSWKSGFLDLGAAYWGKQGFEGMAGIEQNFGSAFTVEAGVEYSWDEEWSEKIFRPRAALRYERGGWQAALRWARDEYLEEQKSPYETFRGRLNRRPELTVSTPWVKSPLSQFSDLRLSAFWGEYREKTLSFENAAARYGAALESCGEVPLGEVDFFWNSRYEIWRYDKSGFGQEVAWGIAGLRYKLGAVELGSGYEIRAAWGESPMNWDDFTKVSRLHQKVRFPIGKESFVVVRGSYDLKYSMVDEVVYGLQWITDCMKWELLYRDDRTAARKDRINLSLALLAFPDTPASFGEFRDTDPFARPRK